MENKYAGMTVNERLWVAGLSGKFEAAVVQKNIVKIIFILFRVELNEESIIPILKSLDLYSEYCKV